MNVTVLVDWDERLGRDGVGGRRRPSGSKLWGVRLDTSETLVDRSLLDEMGGYKPTGVNPRLVRKVRTALDERGYNDVRIVASGGFTVERIREFEAAGVPVDAYGVGLLPDPGRKRLHRRRRARRGPPVREGRPGLFA